MKGAAVCLPKGDLDATTLLTFEAAVDLCLGEPVLIVDLSGVQFLAESGVEAPSGCCPARPGPTDSGCGDRPSGESPKGARRRRVRPDRQRVRDSRLGVVRDPRRCQGCRTRRQPSLTLKHASSRCHRERSRALRVLVFLLRRRAKPANCTSGFESRSTTGRLSPPCHLSPDDCFVA